MAHQTQLLRSMLPAVVVQLSWRPAVRVDWCTKKILKKKRGKQLKQKIDFIDH